MIPDAFDLAQCMYECCFSSAHRSVNGEYFERPCFLPELPGHVGNLIDVVDEVHRESKIDINRRQWTVDSGQYKANKKWMVFCLLSTVHYALPLHHGKNPLESRGNDLCELCPHHSQMAGK